MEAVAPIKLIPSSPSASDLNDWRKALQQGIEKGARCYERPIDYSALNYSRSCKIDAENAWIGLANVKFRNSWGRG